MIFDSHAHYDDKAFDDDREALLASLVSHGVGRVVNVGSNLETTRQTAELVKQYPFLYGAAGVHPSDTGELTEENFGQIEAAMKEEKMVAVGEIGLDYHWDEPEREIQRLWFERQLDLAGRLSVPVIIHSREAARDTLEIIKAAGGPDLSMVIHCFSYGVEMAREYLSMGYYLGVGGVLTFKNAKKLKEVVEYMPLDRLLLETDCPYMAPTPHRGERNSSLNLPYVVETIAAIKGVTGEKVEQITWENANRFYRIREQ